MDHCYGLDLHRTHFVPRVAFRGYQTIAVRWIARGPTNSQMSSSFHRSAEKTELLRLNSPSKIAVEN